VKIGNYIKYATVYLIMPILFDKLAPLINALKALINTVVKRVRFLL